MFPLIVLHIWNVPLYWFQPFAELPWKSYAEITIYLLVHCVQKFSYVKPGMLFTVIACCFQSVKPDWQTFIQSVKQYIWP